MSQTSSQKCPTDVEEGEINEEAPPPTRSNGHYETHSPRLPSSYDARRRRASRSPSPYEPRKRSRRMSNEGNGSDDVMFEEYERLARRHPPSHDRSPSFSSARRDSSHSRPRSRSRHQRERKPSSYRDHASPYSGDTHHDRKHPRRYDDYDDHYGRDRTRSRRHRSSSRDYRSRSESRHNQERQKRHASPPSSSQRHEQEPRREEAQPTEKESKSDQNDTMMDEDFEIKDEHEKQLEEERLIEERRKRRQMILERYKSGTPKATSESPNLEQPTPVTPDESTPADNKNGKADSASPQGISAADYDPSSDRIADDQKQAKDQILRDKDHQEPTGTEDVEEMAAADYTEQKSEPEKQKQQPPAEIDMFSANLDIFADAEGDAAQALLTGAAANSDANPSLLDNWDDAEGYYNVRIGELLDSRYQTVSKLGRGVFSSVVKAKDTVTDEEVAIKIIRNNEIMYKAGLKELGFLNKLKEADPENKKHVIRFIRQFEYRNHLCLVFESLSMNLRDVLKKYGKDVGLSIQAVRVYAQQLFLSLTLLKKCNIVHADIKPDNVLVTESKSMLKLCDLGSASDVSDNEITPYLVSRFYRAPEIIIGLSYEHAIDVWSAACTLYELFTGKILFPGRSNNQMLKHIMEVKGKFPNRLIRKGAFGAQHFDEDNNFISAEVDRISKKEFTKKITFVKPTRDLKSRILAASTANVTEEENKLIMLFIDFLEKCLVLAPEKRMTAREALAHPFITGKLQ